MKTVATKAFIAANLVCATFASHAGFVLETTPAQVAQIRVDSKANAAVGAPAHDGQVRMPVMLNTQASPGLAVGPKHARQRIDLDSRLTSVLTQSGTSPSELPLIRGIGQQVTFEDALRQILPVGWLVFAEQTPPLQKQVDWYGGRTWPMVLHSVMSSIGMRAHVDWDAQELTILASDASVLQSAPATGMGSAMLLSKTVNKDTGPAQDRARFEITRRVIQPGSLRESLRAMAADVGWTLVWNASYADFVVNYDVEAPGFTFVGPVVGADGIIAKVIDLYALAEHPLAVSFFTGNKVVEVRLHETPNMKTSVQFNSEQAETPAKAMITDMSKNNATGSKDVSQSY